MNTVIIAAPCILEQWLKKKHKRALH